MDKHLKESMISSELVFDGRLLKVRKDTVRLPNGGEATREYFRHPGAVVIIPLLDDGRVLLERQYRYPNDQVFLELPAGKAVDLRPGGYHLMLMELRTPLKADTRVPLTLVLRDARGAERRLELQVPVAVRAPAGNAAESGHGHSSHGGHRH